MLLLSMIFTKQFLKQKAGTLLLFGIIISSFEFIVLFIAAKSEDVLVINNGIGLLNNYGVFATLLGDAFLIYLIKKFYEEISNFFSTLKIKDKSFIQKESQSLIDIISLKTNHKYLLILFILIGLLANISNVMFHILDLSEEHWGTLVFDSTDHIACFILNRINAFFSWAIILPFCLYITVWTINSLIKMFDYLVKNSLIEYDLLNPDRCGGLSFAGTSNIYFNFTLAIVYLQITLHITTFNATNFEHIFGYLIVTICFLFGNSFFINNIFSKIKKLRIEILNKWKNDIYNNNSLSFDIYKYYQDSFSSQPYTKKAMYVINLTKAATVSLPFVIKIATKIFT